MSTDVSIGKVSEYEISDFYGVFIGDLLAARKAHHDALVKLERILLRLDAIDQRERWALNQSERQAYWKNVTR